VKRPSDRSLRLLGYGTIATAASMGAATFVLALTSGEIGWALQTVALIGAFSATTTLAMRSQPGNGAVWALVGAAFFGAASSLGSQLASARTGFTVAVIEDGGVPGSPADYDLISALGINVSLWAWVPSVFLLATVLLILFPDGSVPSRRWRIAIWSAGFCMVALSIQGAVTLAPWVTTPYERLLADGDGTVLAAPIGLLMMPLMVIALAAVFRIILSYRRSEGEERLQYRWVAWALGLYVIVGIFFFAALQTLGEVGGLISNLLLANIAVSIGVAIAKYRLYDIDAVISRTFVYGSLAAFIGGVYVAIVVGVGQLLGSSDEPNAALAIGATAIIATAFQPLRQRLDRVANRLVYGRKATPYEVLSTFSRRVAATDDSLLIEAARGLVDGTAASRATVTTTVGRTRVEAASWPPRFSDGPSIDATSFAITHDGEELGELTLELPRGQRLPEADRRLAAELASGMGLALQNRALTATLEGRVAELRQSRRRLVAVRDETRRQLERDLHDGAQQQLVALKVKLGLARAMAERDEAPRTAELLRSLGGEADQTVEAMREFARGVYPPLLEAEGLESVIRSQARRLDIPVAVDTTGIGRFDRQTESTVYFCVLEALDNVARHANPTSANVVLRRHDGRLEIEVTDDGAGFDPEKTIRGSGITNMIDRVGALDGEVEIESSGGGTTVRASIPVSSPPAEASSMIADEEAVGSGIPAEVGGGA